MGYFILGVEFNPKIPPYVMPTSPFLFYWRNFAQKGNYNQEFKSEVILGFNGQK
jgi:hypothetical protein